MAKKKPKWEPKYPDVAQVHKQGPASEFDQTGPSWVSVPDVSHLLAFRFYDSRKYPFLDKMNPPGSQIQIRYRANGVHPATEYTYWIDDPATAERIFNMMRETDHPGIVAHRYLEGIVPYRKIAIDQHA